MRAFILLFIGLCCISCSNTVNTIATTKNGKNLRSLLHEQSFEIVSDWASPVASSAFLNLDFLFPFGSTPNSINIGVNSNTFIKKGNEIEILLPYFGEQRGGVGYNNEDGSIKWKGVPEDYTEEYNEEKNFYKIQFSMSKRTEVYSFTIRLYQNLTSRIFVNSSHRTAITYTGTVKDVTSLRTDQ